MCWQHLNAVLPDNEDYEEMICAGCMEKHDFLWAYQVTSQGHYSFMCHCQISSQGHRFTCHAIKSPVHAIGDVCLRPKYCQISSHCHRLTCHTWEYEVQVIMDLFAIL